MIWQRWYFLWELVGTFVQLSQYLAFLARSFQLHMFPHSYQRRSLISRLPKIFHIINYHFSKVNNFRNHQDWHPPSPPHNHYHPNPHHAGNVCLNLTTRLCLKNLRRKFTARPTPLRQTMIKMVLMIGGRFWITLSLFWLLKKIMCSHFPFLIGITSENHFRVSPQNATLQFIDNSLPGICFHK